MALISCIGTTVGVGSLMLDLGNRRSGPMRVPRLVRFGEYS